MQYSNHRGAWCCQCESMYRNSTVMEQEEEEEDYDDEERATGYTETERFLQCLDYHRALLFDYTRRWEGDEADDPLYKEADINNNAPKVPPIVWPRNVPTADEISALELDLQFCLWSPGYRDNQRTCQNQAFRVASYYLSLKDNPDAQHKGYFIVKDLAHHGHPDGMCLYGKEKNDGDH